MVSNHLIWLRCKTARVAQFLRLGRLADAIRPPVTPWYLRRPLEYTEHFTGGEDVGPVDTALAPVYEDVTLAHARWADEGKRAKLIEVAFTEPDPVKAGQAAAELRHMIFQGRDHA